MSRSMLEAAFLFTARKVAARQLLSPGRYTQNARCSVDERNRDFATATDTLGVHTIVIRPYPSRMQRGKPQ
jgi:hypothetical protein